MGNPTTKSGLDTNLQQGPFEFGPSQFDINSIMAAIGGNTQATTNRYDQLGLGGSTPEKEDLSQVALESQAAQGQLQNTQVLQPAFNPALQPAQTNVPSSAIIAENAANSQAGAALGKTIGTVAGLGLKAL